MRESGRLFWVLVGMALGALGVAAWFLRAPTALAGSNDRHDDFILCTGAVSTNLRAPTDGVCKRSKFADSEYRQTAS